MRRLVAVFVGLAACGVAILYAVLSGGDGQKAPASAPSFTAVYEGEPGLVIEVPGTGVRRPLLRPPLSGVGSWALSPLADRVAFVRRKPAAGAGLYVVGRSGRNARRVQRLSTAEAAATRVVAWTDDASTIVRVSSSCGDRPRPAQISVTTGTKSRTIRLEKAPARSCVVSAAVSPSGDKLAYTIADGVGQPLEAHDIDLRSGLDTVVASRVGSTVAWSPDEKTLALLDCGNAGCQVDTVPSAGGSPAPVSPPQFQDGAGLAWSPKGDEVLVGESSGLQACNVSTTDVRSVAVWPDIIASSGAEILDFSDDGRFAAVGTSNGSGVSLFVVALDGKSPTKDYILFWNTVGAFSVRFRHDR